jgi:hypothetical protein
MAASITFQQAALHEIATVVLLDWSPASSGLQSITPSFEDSSADTISHNLPNAFLSPANNESIVSVVFGGTFPCSSRIPNVIFALLASEGCPW